MKIRCDVCEIAEASIFCVADEAAICPACDQRVHHANKLASKHRRFSLLQPSSAKQFPLCDVCQEKRAFLFCQQDRAMLCRDCEVPIHSATEHTKKHDRFLLTGIKLSATSDLYTPSKPALTDGDPSFASDLTPKPEVKTPVSESVSASSAMLNLESSSKISSNIPHAVPLNKGGEENWIANEGGGSSSSISEYLIDMLPGWKVEDLLDLSPSPFGFRKETDETILLLMDDELENSLSDFWVPQAASSLRPPETMSGLNMLNDLEEWNVKVNREGWIDDGFTVPQIHPASSGFKRSRPFW